MSNSSTAQQGGSQSPAPQQQGQEPGQPGKPAPQQQGGTPVFRDWAAI